MFFFFFFFFLGGGSIMSHFLQSCYTKEWCHFLRRAVFTSPFASELRRVRAAGAPGGGGAASSAGALRGTGEDPAGAVPGTAKASRDEVTHSDS